MMRNCLKFSAFIALILLASVELNAQDGEGTMYFSNLLLSNPAYTGASGSSSIILSYRDYYPGYGFGLGSLYGSWDSYFEPLHGGAGVYIFENRLGDILNDLRAGGTYAYHLRAGRDIYINAGFMATMIHRSVNTGGIILPDQIDPLLGPVLPSGEIIGDMSRTLFDTGIGFLFIYRNYNAGFSVNHIATPDLTGSGSRASMLARRYSVHGAASFELKNRIKLDPLLAASFQSGVVTASGGMVASYNVLNINIITHFDSRQGVNALQAGLFVEKGALALGYNHYFMPFRNEISVPFTLSAQVSVKVNLFTIEKRDNTGTIKTPNL